MRFAGRQTVGMNRLSPTEPIDILAAVDAMIKGSLTDLFAGRAILHIHAALLLALRALHCLGLEGAAGSHQQHAQRS